MCALTCRAAHPHQRLERRAAAAGASGGASPLGLAVTIGALTPVSCTGRCLPGASSIAWEELRAAPLLPRPRVKLDSTAAVQAEGERPDASAPTVQDVSARWTSAPSSRGRQAEAPYLR